MGFQPQRGFFNGRPGENDTVAIAFDQMSRLERDHGNGTNVGKAIAIGLASGAGVILGLFILALQFD